MNSGTNNGRRNGHPMSNGLSNGLGVRPGISGFAVYVPPFRVPLESWCEWYGHPWNKVSKVVGRSFRQLGPHESLYTMAANAVLRLMDAYEIDPQEVGYLGLGTESSTDNAAGAVIVRGMVDAALEEQGRPRLSRHCEVPEVKHACLGGVYAMKGALRYLATDGHARKAIVVCGDIAEYERGSSGEQTQGAGAVAMLLEAEPKLCRVDLAAGGSSSAYRGMDFRKPFVRHESKRYTPEVRRQHDFPVFNGRYSTFCYLDAVAYAARDLFSKTDHDPIGYYQGLGALLFHRPYHWMPVQALATLYVWGLARSSESQDQLQKLCDEAGVSMDDVQDEISSSKDLFSAAREGGVDVAPYPKLDKVAKIARGSDEFEALREKLMTLGADKMMDVGNIYTAALIAWMAAAFEDAAEKKADLTERTLLCIGYGSGDAAEAFPVTVVPNWEEAARRIGFGRALEGAVDLNRPQYEALHDGHVAPGLAYEPRGEFIVECTGGAVDPTFQDIGIEYYRYEHG